MKNLLLILLLCCTAICSQAQSTAEQMSSRIAQKMKDSLGLNETQRQQLYDINMQLVSEKQAARAASTDREVVGRQLQQIENTRDGLYKPVIGDEKFILYKQKKNNLVSNQ